MPPPLGHCKEAILNVKRQSLPAFGIKNVFPFWKPNWAGITVGGLMDNLYSMPVPPGTPWKTGIPASPGDRSAWKEEDEENHRDGCRLPSPSLFNAMPGERRFSNLEEQKVTPLIVKK